MLSNFIEKHIFYDTINKKLEREAYEKRKKRSCPVTKWKE
jgi:hypothetical protein